MAFLWRISVQSGVVFSGLLLSSRQLHLHIASKLQKKCHSIRCRAVLILDLHQNHHVLRLGQFIE